MKRIGCIATRDFISTVMTRGFVIAVLLFPALTATAVALIPRLLNQRSEQVRGQVVVVDPTGVVTRELRTTMTPQAIANRRDELARRALAAAPREVRELAGQNRAAAPSIDRLNGPAPDLQIVERLEDAGDPSLRAAKAWLSDLSSSPRHVAVIVVHANAVSQTPGQSDEGAYDLYVPPNLDDRIETVIYESVRDALVNARAAALRLDRGQLDAIVQVQRATSTTVSKGIERATMGVFNRVLPFAFCGLLLITVMIGGQGLVTSTVEEKSSRVIEVLLSAASPFEILAGKILGQMGVSLVMLGIYIALAFLTLVSFAVFGLLDLSLVAYLFVFFVITYLTIGSLMAAAGAAVNDMREAQALMMPIILVMMIPWVLAMPIAREPNSTFSTALSFIPPVNTFAMLLRMTSAAPPPVWQVWLTIVIGAGAVVVSIWCAAKIFTIGLLMYGKPPDLKTLGRWIREA